MTKRRGFLLPIPREGERVGVGGALSAVRNHPHPSPLPQGRGDRNFCRVFIIACNQGVMRRVSAIRVRVNFSLWLLSHRRKQLEKSPLRGEANLAIIAPLDDVLSDPQRAYARESCHGATVLVLAVISNQHEKFALIPLPPKRTARSPGTGGKPAPAIVPGGRVAAISGCCMRLPRGYRPGGQTRRRRIDAEGMLQELPVPIVARQPPQAMHAWRPRHAIAVPGAMGGPGIHGPGLRGRRRPAS